VMLTPTDSEKKQWSIQQWMWHFQQGAMLIN
jgi:hypothetical protein